MGQDIRGWIAAAAMLLAGINTLWMWIRSARMPTEAAIAKLEAAIDKLDTTIDDHDRRVAKIEGEMRHLPTKDDLHKVTVSLGTMVGKMDVISTELAGTSRTLRRMEDHMRGPGQ